MPRAENTMLERLQKILAKTGVASRRKCEEIIAAGRVRVDGEVVTKMGRKVDPRTTAITVDGKRLSAEKLVYILLNKPAGYLCTTEDEFGRKKVTDLIPRVRERIFPVGRLDEDTEGLIILTNDGALANILTHPRYGVRKTYAARVRGRITREAIRELKRGVYLPDGKAVAEDVSVNFIKGGESAVTLVLREGRNHIVKKMLSRLGFPVKKLKRTRIAFLTLHKLARGAYRRLGESEVERLHALAQRRQEAAPSRRRKNKADNTTRIRESRK